MCFYNAELLRIRAHAPTVRDTCAAGFGAALERGRRQDAPLIELPQPSAISHQQPVRFPALDCCRPLPNQRRVNEIGCCETPSSVTDSADPVAAWSAAFVAWISTLTKRWRRRTALEAAENGLLQLPERRVECLDRARYSVNLWIVQERVVIQPAAPQRAAAEQPHHIDATALIDVQNGLQPVSSNDARQLVEVRRGVSATPRYQMRAAVTAPVAKAAAQEAFSSPKDETIDGAE